MQPEQKKPALPWNVDGWTGWPIRLLIDNGNGGFPLSGVVEEVIMQPNATPIALHVSPGPGHHTLVIPWSRIVHASATAERGW